MRPIDTTKEAALLQLEAQRRLGPARRLQIAMEMSDWARSLAEAGYRARHPGATPEEVTAGLIRELYGSLHD